ncbi:MAG: hypothetical protein JSV31_07250 [Desulfobacterales bacterium]|nr:MAG: hypothetical protein JSV31_07250 [Desulfobacterales bacterium]
MKRNQKIIPYMDEEIKSVVLSLEPTNDKLAKLILGDRRSGLEERRKLPTYIADDRRSGIADRRTEAIALQNEPEIIKALIELWMMGYKRFDDEIAEKSAETNKRVEEFIHSFKRHYKKVLKSISLSMNEALNGLRQKENQVNQLLDERFQMYQQDFELFKDKQKDTLDQISSSNEQLCSAYLKIRDEHQTLENSFNKIQKDIQDFKTQMTNQIVDLTVNFSSELKDLGNDLQQEFEGRFKGFEKSVDDKIVDITNRLNNISNELSKKTGDSRLSLKLVWTAVLVSILIGAIALIVSL